MTFDIDPLLVFYGSAGVAVALLAEAVYLLLRNAKSYRSGVNRRLQLSDREPSREKVLVQLRRERGLSSQGEEWLPLAVFNRLILQSGVTVSLWRALFSLSALGITAFGAVFAWRGDVALAGAAAAASVTLLPVAGLMYLRARRLKAFGAQFPEAIDIIVRSLRAGHPTPVAIAMVAREMPDPIGSEFGMVADEITYGSELETALRGMMARVGHEDLPLFVTSIAIQASTGGNLSQILDNLAKVIRERFKMRRKIRGLAAEGRASALILNITPLAVFLLINAISPDFYGEAWKHPMTKYAFAGAIGWMAIGNLIMRRMINFRI